MELSDAIEVSRVNNVFMRTGPRASQVGSLVLLGHHLIFSPNNQSPSLNKSEEELWLLHRAVDRACIEPLVKDQPSRGGLLSLMCKNFMIIIFEISIWEDCQAAARSIETLSNINGCSHDYPFYYRCPFQVLDDGWKAFDSSEEFARLIVRCGDEFRISNVNDGFQVCPSYPEKVIVPKGIGDDYLRISATFRDGSRFPVLSYFHNSSQSAIVRCGQPLIGPTNRRCKEDEHILNSLLAHSRGTIIDTRAKHLAQSSRSKGGGFESQMYYSQFRYMYFPIPRIREIQLALARIVELCNDKLVSCDRFMARLAISSWLHCVSDSLNCAANVAQCVHLKEVPVIVHGGEGTDTTLLATSLAQIILDPDVRTIRGFQSLIEREWICAGHPFQLRNAHSAYAQGAVTGSQESPVFLCFLDAVNQIISQYPLAFEFDEEFLIFLFEHAYASEFGSFLGNNEMMKAELGVKTSTVSLWSYVNNPEILRSFVNSSYEPRESVLWPSVAPQSIQLWRRLFFRWQLDWTENDQMRKYASQWRSRERELISRALSLKRQLVELTKESLFLPISVSQ
uniref:Myotubularin phosphatase domain-containing protein n=1 Tax=Haemonchus contortus TaxID=6289 RepID=A0A7I5EF34_HAECO